MFLLGFFLIVSCETNRNFAVLCNSSIDFSNYRHSSNVYLLKKILTNNGYKEDDILCLLSEDSIYDQRNLHKGKVYYSSNEYINVERINGVHASVNSLLNILRCNHSNMRSLDESNNLLIYLCGHGGDEFLKFMDRDCLLKNDLVYEIRQLSKRVGKILLILDTCQAESFVDNFPDNVTVIVTSIKGESSVSSDFNKNLGVAVVDRFLKLLYEDYVRDDITNLFSFFENFDFERLESHLKIFGNDKKVKMDEFFLQKETSDEVLPFKIDDGCC